MAKPHNLKTKIFLDSSNPQDTKDILTSLGFLDGQTTNPSLVAKNPEVVSWIEQGNTFSKREIEERYKLIIQDISKLIPESSISIEVYANDQSTSQELLEQALVMNTWIPKAHIKFPTIPSGLQAAEEFVGQGGRVNMTLVFTEEQAMAVHLATMNMRQKGDVFVSPFIGRLDDIGRNGMDLIKNILTTYRSHNSQVEVLAASVRTVDQFLECLRLECDIITAPTSVLLAWGKKGLAMPGQDFTYNPSFEPIPPSNKQWDENWRNLDLGHPLTSKGLDKFAKDWEALISVDSTSNS